MNRLVAAILIKAVDDWNDPKFQSDVKEFLESEWFDQLAEMLEMEPEMIRGKLLKGNYKHLVLRAAYR